MSRPSPSDDPRKTPADKGRPSVDGVGRASPDEGVLARAQEKRREAEQLIARQDFDAAAPILQRLAALSHESTREIAAWARNQSQRLRQREAEAGRETESVCRLARKLLAKSDFAEAITMLSSIPASQATDESQELLDEATEKQEELDTLRGDIEKAMNVRDYDEARPLVFRFLEIKPGDRRMQELWEKLNTYGGGGAVRGMRRERSYGSSEGFGLFSAVGMAWIVMGAAFAGGLIAVTVYLRDDRRTVAIEVDELAKSKEVGLGIADKHYRVESIKKGVLLTPGRHTVSLTVARVEVQAVEVNVEKGKPLPGLAVTMEGDAPRLMYASEKKARDEAAATEAAQQAAAAAAQSTTTVVANTTPNPPPQVAIPPVAPDPARGRPQEKPFELPANAPPEAHVLFRLMQKVPPNSYPVQAQVRMKDSQRNQNRNASRPVDIPLEPFEITNISLPDAADLDADDLALLGQMPALRYVTLYGTKWTGDELNSLKGHAVVESVTMQPTRSDETETRPCLAAPHLAEMPSLRSLVLSGFTLTDDDLKLLAGCRKLDTLTLSADGTSPEGIAELAALPDLRYLTLRWRANDTRGLTDDGLAAFKGMPGLSNLTLSRCPELTGAGFQQMGKLNSLRQVSLSECPLFDDEGLRALAFAAPNLTYLTINQAPRGEVSTDSAVTSKGFAALRPLKSLQSLTIHSAKGIVDFGVGTITSLPALRTLDLTGAGLTDEGMEAIARHKGILNLNLTRVQMGDAGCAHLAKMSQLQDLTLEQTEISDEGLKALKPLKQLRRLSIYQTNTSKEAADELKDGQDRLSIRGPS